MRLTILLAWAMATSTGLAARPAWPGSNLKIESKQLTFRHESADGENALSCRHSLADALSQDWDVRCFDAAGKERKRFNVHLWATLYTHPSTPKASYEVLYWLIDFTNMSQPRSHSTTAWFHLKEPGALHALDLAQGTDDDTASLRLNLAF